MRKISTSKQQKSVLKNDIVDIKSTRDNIRFSQESFKNSKKLPRITYIM